MSRRLTQGEWEDDEGEAERIRRHMESAQKKVWERMR